MEKSEGETLEFCKIGNCKCEYCKISKNSKFAEFNGISLCKYPLLTKLMKLEDRKEFICPKNPEWVERERQKIAEMMKHLFMDDVAYIITELCNTCKNKCEILGTLKWHCLKRDTIPKLKEDCGDYAKESIRIFICENCKDFDGYYDEKNDRTWSCLAGVEPDNINHAVRCNYFKPKYEVKMNIFDYAKQFLRLK